MYECIFAIRDARRRRGRYWLRLYGTCRTAVAIVTEVRGNLGPPATDAIARVARALVERFSLEPAGLTLIEHHPPGPWNDQASFDLVRMAWVGATPTRPHWVRLTPEALARAVGELAPTGQPLWVAPSRDWFVCTVGGRGAAVGREGGGAWQALVNIDPERVATEQGFGTREQAMCWALDTLANAAAELDPAPLVATGRGDAGEHSPPGSPS